MSDGQFGLERSRSRPAREAWLGLTGESSTHAPERAWCLSSRAVAAAKLGQLALTPSLWESLGRWLPGLSHLPMALLTRWRRGVASWWAGSACLGNTLLRQGALRSSPSGSVRVRPGPSGSFLGRGIEFSILRDRNTHTQNFLKLDIRRYYFHSFTVSF